MRSRDNKRAQAILAAAEAILAESGVPALTARAVAERADVPKGLVFYYWDSTAALVDDVLERYYQRHADALRIAATGGDDADAGERIHHIVDAYLDFMVEHRTYARIVQHQVSAATAASPVVTRYLAELLRVTTALLDDVAPPSGPLSAKHFFLSLSAVVVNYFTYAPAIGADAWGAEPLSPKALQERRDHVHWIADAWLAGLAAR